MNFEKTYTSAVKSMSDAWLKVFEIRMQIAASLTPNGYSLMRVSPSRLEGAFNLNHVVVVYVAGDTGKTIRAKIPDVMCTPDEFKRGLAAQIKQRLQYA